MVILFIKEIVQTYFSAEFKRISAGVVARTDFTHLHGQRE